MFFLIISVTKRESAKIITLERYSASPEKFTFDYRKCQFAIGLKNDKEEHFKDETIYKVIA